jgi:hypothetical protein
MRVPGSFHNHGTNDELFTIHRAAGLVGIPVHELTDAVSQGRLPVVEVSGCKCIKLADLLKFREGVSDER